MRIVVLGSSSSGNSTYMELNNKKNNDNSNENDFKDNILKIKGFILDKVKFSLIC